MSTHSRKKALLKRTVQWLAAGAVPFVITACYGPPGGHYPEVPDDEDTNALDSVTSSSSDITTDSGTGTNTVSASTDATLSGTVVDVGGNGIGGILVSCLDADGAELASTYTDTERGAFMIEIPVECATVQFEDEDGAASGGAFESVSFPLSEMASDGQEVTLTAAQ